MTRRRTFFLAPLAACALFSSACNRKAEVAQAPTPTPTPVRVSAEDIKKHRPNEAGAVMVVMYHRILSTEPDNDLNRRPETFAKDLKTLRDKGYHPVNALDLVQNTMKVPAGKTPVVLTFDDALPSQFKVVTGSDGKDHIDPTCAVGIMETFSKQHNDWPQRATFFVLPGGGRNAPPFGQEGSIARKFKYLAARGYEVANHTTTHANMRRMDAGTIQVELAGAVKSIQQISPAAAMKTLALPYGKLPREKAVRKYLQAGTSGGQTYSHKAVFLAAWRPVASPITRADRKLARDQIAIFDPTALERVTADARNPNTAGTFEYWISWFDKNRDARYVSDGVDEIVSAPAAMKNAIDPARIQAQNKKLQLYSEGSGAEASTSGGKDGKGAAADGGDDLSVR